MHEHDFNSFKKKRVKLISDKYNLDMLIGSLPENILYLSSFKSLSHSTLHRVQAYALYIRKDDILSLVLPTADIATFFEQHKNLKVYCYGDFFFSAPKNNISLETEKIKDITDQKYRSPEEALIEAISKSGIKRGRIGLDESRVSPQVWMTVVSTFSDIEFVPGMNIFSEIRMIKHEKEIDYLEKAAVNTEASLFVVLSQLKIKMTEKELEQLYASEIVKRGGLPFFAVVTEGVRSAYSDTFSTNRNIDNGSLLRFDIGSIYEDYRADIARTAVVGKHSSKVEDYYKYIGRRGTDTRENSTWCHCWRTI